MWVDLLKIKDIYLHGREVKVGRGNLTRFWNDPWLFQEPLCMITPLLFELAEDKKMTVAQFKGGVQVTFRRWLPGELRSEWEVILNAANAFQLIDQLDSVTWSLGGKRHFTVKSIYEYLTNPRAGPSQKKIWKSRILGKIKNLFVVNGQRCCPD